MPTETMRRCLRWLTVLFAPCVVLLACHGHVSVVPTSNSADGGVAAPDGERIPVSPDDAVRGGSNAYVTWVLFADFRCPVCIQLSSIVDRIREMYPSDVLRIDFKHYPSTNLAQAKLASTVAQGVFAVKGLAAFARYRDLANHDPQPINPTVIRQWALSSGLHADELDLGLEHGLWADKVDRDILLGRRLGVSQPPVSFVNGVAVAGAPPLETWKAVIDVELAKAKVLEQSGVPREKIYAQAVAANSADPKGARIANELEDPKAVWKVPVGTSPTRGNPTALVTIVEYSTFDCPACKHASQTLERVRVAFGDKVRLVWKDAPPLSHQRIAPAVYLARAARAQKGDAGFWDMHDRLFGAAQLEEADLSMAAESAGLDVKVVMASVHDQTYRKEVEADLELAEDVEVNVPPQFFVNGRRLIGDPTYEALTATVEEEVHKAEALLRSGIEPTALYDWFIKDGQPSDPIKKNVPLNPNAPFKGAATGPLVIQEFAEVQCPRCVRLEPMLDELVKTYPNVIKVAWRDLPTPAHPDAELAAEAAREAYVQKGNEGFWRMQQRMAMSATLGRDDLVAAAREVGLDGEKFLRALDGRVHKTEIDLDMRVAADAAIVSTPTLVIGGYVLGGVPSLARLSRFVRRAVAELPKAPVSSRVAAKFSIVDLVIGSGPPAKLGEEITIHYRGKLLDGSEFSSTYRRGPFTFTLGAGNVIEGWDRGIPGMRVGGRRRLTIPPELGYGNHGVGKAIPANSVTVYEVELLKIN